MATGFSAIGALDPKALPKTHPGASAETGLPEAELRVAILDATDPLLELTVEIPELAAAVPMPGNTKYHYDPVNAPYEWRAYFGVLDNRMAMAAAIVDEHNAIEAKSTEPRLLGEFLGVGFPHIESGNRPASARYKPFSKMISYRQIGVDESRREPIPHLGCMGLSPKSVARRVDRYDQLILELAIQHQISASLVKAVVTEESCFNPKAVSPVGAIGLMQLMPATAKWLKVRKPTNPAQNLGGGIRYLAMLRERFGEDELALAAYNAGPSRVVKYGGIPPFKETRNYVKRVMNNYRRYVAATRVAIEQ